MLRSIQVQGDIISDILTLTVSKDHGELIFDILTLTVSKDLVGSVPEKLKNKNRRF